MTVVDPKVVSENVEGAAAQITLIVPSDLEYFDGHFPGMAIVPGVVQLKWAIESARRYLGVNGAVVRIEAVKFQRAMTPDTEVDLIIRYGAETRKLHFSFESDDGCYSSGRIVFAPC